MQDLKGVSAEDLSFAKLASYCAYMWPQYKFGSHHLKIIRALEAVERGDITRLMITMPPRHGKSMLASEYFPAWYLGRNSDHYVVAATYAQELADDFGRKVRNQIADASYSAIFPGVGLKSDSTSSRRFHVTQPLDSFITGQNGAYFAVGVGGPLTGRGAHLLLIDDPVKNREDAESEVIRKKTKDWYTSTAYTRLMPGGRIVVIQTRWHEDDLAGWLQDEHMHEGWTVLDLPAINDAGEALWPEQYNVQDLERIKRAISPRDWSALYQQRPSPETGDYFKKEWIHEVDVLPPVQTLRIYGASDYAVTQSGGDYTVHAVVGVDPSNRLYLLDVWRNQTSSDKWVESFCDLVKKWKPIGWAEETGQIKSGVGPFLIKTMLEKGAYVAREQFPTRGDKAIRAQSFRGRIASNGLYIHRDAPWKSDVISEMMSFPVGVHDDACLIANTMVSTVRGKVPIQFVRHDDYALTPEGLKRVLASELTSQEASVYDVTFSDGRTLTATGNHPVFVRGKGFVRVDALCVYDSVVQNGEHICAEDRQRLKSSNTEGIGIGATQKASILPIGNTSLPQNRAVGSFIGICGRMLLGLSQKAMKSTIRTTIQTTIRSTISSVLRRWNTITVTRTLKSNLRSRGNTLTGFEESLLIGTNPMPVENGIGSTAKTVGLDGSWFLKSANVAGGCSQLTSLAVGASAVAPALSVIAVEPRKQRQPVYNLKVEGCPMYYANGVLTHNCDALGLVGQLLDRMMAGVPEPEKEHVPDGEKGYYVRAPILKERKRR